MSSKNGKNRTDRHIAHPLKRQRAEERGERRRLLAERRAAGRLPAVISREQPPQAVVDRLLRPVAKPEHQKHRPLTEQPAGPIGPAGPLGLLSRYHSLTPTPWADPVSIAAPAPPVQPQSSSAASAVNFSSPLFCDAHNRPLHLDGLCRNSSIFLILSGPSLLSLPLALLSQRGIVSFAVNQAPSVVRPHFWIAVDQPRKFHEGTWRDPGILKFVPFLPDKPKKFFRQPLQHKDEVTKQFSPLADPETGKEILVGDCPGVVGYHRNAYFDPENWLSESSINWGNSPKSARKNKQPSGKSVMFAALKTAYVLGFRTVYLLGCDFRMQVDQPYSFNQNKSVGGCASNNGMYAKMNAMLGMLKPHFDAAGFQIFSCTPNSGLRIFPYRPFEAAIAEARNNMPSEPWDTVGWYETVGRN